MILTFEVFDYEYVICYNLVIILNQKLLTTGHSLQKFDSEKHYAILTK